MIVCAQQLFNSILTSFVPVTQLVIETLTFWNRGKGEEFFRKLRIIFSPQMQRLYDILDMVNNILSQVPFFSTWNTYKERRMALVCYFESVVPALTICFINMYSSTHALLYIVYAKEKKKKSFQVTHNHKGEQPFNLLSDRDLTPFHLKALCFYIMFVVLFELEYKLLQK